MQIKPIPSAHMSTLSSCTALSPPAPTGDAAAPRDALSDAFSFRSRSSSEAMRSSPPASEASEAGVIPAADSWASSAEARFLSDARCSTSTADMAWGRGWGISIGGGNGKRGRNSWRLDT